MIRRFPGLGGAQHLAGVSCLPDQIIFGTSSSRKQPGQIPTEPWWTVPAWMPHRCERRIRLDSGRVRHQRHRGKESSWLTYYRDLFSENLGTYCENGFTVMRRQYQGGSYNGLKISNRKVGHIVWYIQIGMGFNRTSLGEDIQTAVQASGMLSSPMRTVAANRESAHSLHGRSIGSLKREAVAPKVRLGGRQSIPDPDDRILLRLDMAGLAGTDPRKRFRGKPSECVGRGCN